MKDIFIEGAAMAPLSPKNKKLIFATPIPFKQGKIQRYIDNASNLNTTALLHISKKGGKQ